MQRSVFVTGLAFFVAMVNSAPAADSNAPAAESNAPATDFWGAQDPATKKCKVSEKKPDGAKKVMIGATSYPTKEEAKAAKKAALEAGVCVDIDAKKD